MGKSLRLWAFSVKATGKSWMRDRPVFRAFSVFIRDSDWALFLFFLTGVCGAIKGWSFYEMLLCQAHRALSYGILLVFFTGIRDYRKYSEDMDKYFLKPAGVLWQMLLENTDWFAFLGHFSRGILFLVIGCVGCKVEFTAVKGLFLVLNLLGGALIQAAIWLVVNTLWMAVESEINWKSLLFYIPGEVTSLPLSWFPKGLVNFFTFLLPWGFVSFYPTLQLLGRNEGMPEICRYLSLPIGIALYLLAYGIWRLGLYFYRK